ncbi:Helicase associated domain protein [Kitasatospora sp. NPDC091207]|uniref:helicase associated domain-containing protein n=1 Tax=Kitasatospora sp. NPDC091207 TaxID=3364083 RepID=UPI00380AD905
MTALAVAGSDKLKDRRAAFATFSASTGERPGEEGEECCIICNSRLLNEGIDVAAVDAIVFADPKSSVIDVVRAVGRALRLSYRQGKVSWVIIPVYLPTPEVGDDTTAADPAEVRDAGEAARAEADTEIEASSFRTIWRVLRALAAHDARVVGRITELRAKRAGEKDHTAVSEAGAGEDVESGAGDAERPAPTESPVEWLRINARKHAVQILQTVKLRAFNPRATEWQRMYGLAAAFRALHGHLDASDKTVDGDLVSWLDRQRYLKGAGLLAPTRVNELDRLDMIWDKHAHSWERGFAHARDWAARHGHLAIPAAEKLDGHGVGAWMGRQRKNAKLTAVQDAKLTRGGRDVADRAGLEPLLPASARLPHRRRHPRRPRQPHRRRRRLDLPTGCVAAQAGGGPRWREAQRPADRTPGRRAAGRRRAGRHLTRPAGPGRQAEVPHLPRSDGDEPDEHPRA